ncbi:MAG: nitroreductase family protein [Candidatus Anstonellales archaeon]
MDVLDIIRRRYAAKEFNSEKVDDNQINYILESIRLAPSSYNLQPWSIIVVSDQKIKEQLYEYSYRQRQIITASDIFVFLTDLNIDRILNELKAARLDYGDDPNRVDQYISKLRAELSTKSREQLRSYLEHQTYIALGFAMLAAESLGIASCPMGGFEERGYRAVLGIEEDYAITVLLAIGYVTDRRDKKIRKQRVLLRRV